MSAKIAAISPVAPASVMAGTGSLMFMSALDVTIGTSLADLSWTALTSTASRPVTQ
jgi:hypothetical protein